MRKSKACVRSKTKARIDVPRFWILLLLVSVPSCTPASFPGEGADAPQTVVYRDSWGVPHIYAPTAAAGCYGMGWAQAQDRPEELLRNFLRATGEISSVDGPPGFRSDWVAHLWDHYGVAQAGLARAGEAVRPCLSRFVEGINDYYAAHPADLPAWWGQRRVDEAMVLAFARLFLYSWSIDDGFGDLVRGGVQPGLARTERGSNQFAVAPQRAREGAAILAIDPHLSWWGISRFWEFRIHAGELQGSGVTLPGFPTIGLGHNRFLAWAMTTGGPDTADVYRLELRPGNTLQYRYDGEWRELSSREVEITVRGEEQPRRLRLLASHHGPVVALQKNSAYAIRMAYAQEVGILDAWWTLNLGRSYRDAEAALATLQFFPQNVMVADVDGNIYYQRTGRVPRRPAGLDWSRPVDGSTSRTEWDGFHPASELVQILNPPQGYMQNCNVPPDAMMRRSPLLAERYPAPVYSDAGHGPPGGWSNPRAARAVQLLDADSDLSATEAMDIILDVHPFGVERWLEALRLADQRAGSRFQARQAYARARDTLMSWDGDLRRDSTGALVYFEWRRLLEEGAPSQLEGLSKRLDDYRESLGEASPGVELSPVEAETMCEALAQAGELEQQRSEGVWRSYGDVFRVGRGDASWPLGGGGPVRLGLSTLRSVGYGEPRPDGTRWGRSGQTATMIVVLRDPIRSWSAVPIGQSDRVDSPHFRDQAEKLFSPRRLKPTWWTPRELSGQVASREVLP